MVELVGLGSAMNGATLSIFFEILINYERANKIVPHIEYEHCPIEPVSLNSFFPLLSVDVDLACLMLPPRQKTRLGSPVGSPVLTPLLILIDTP